VQINRNLIDAIRPPVERSLSPVFMHPLKFSGRSTGDKLSYIRDKLFSEGSANGLYILPVLPSIAWLLNLRCRDDVPNTPIFRSYVTLTQTECVLFVDGRKIPSEVGESLRRDGVLVKPYGVEQVKEYVVNWKKSEQGHGRKVVAPPSVSWGLVHQIKMAISVRHAEESGSVCDLTGSSNRKRSISFRVRWKRQKRSRMKPRSRVFETPTSAMELRP
jgi:Xaa-Pro aminopeptidase